MFQHLKLTRPLAVFDLETTGTDPATDRIVEISIIKIQPDGTNETKTRRLNPTIPIPGDATKIHHITDADVANERTFNDYSKGIKAFLDGCDLCGFNIKKFDLPLLLSEFRRCNVSLELEGRLVIDAMSIYHHFEKRNLEAAVEFYLNRKHPDAHSAEEDTKATIEILDEMASRYQDLPKSPQEIAEFLRPKNAVDQDGKFSSSGGFIHFTFGKHRGTALDEVAKSDPGFLQWMLRSDFSLDTKRVAREALVRAGNAG